MTKTDILFFGFIILLFYVKHSACLKYVPPDREVEVIQNSKYTIGIDDALDLDVVICSFTSNTGLGCTFEVTLTRRHVAPYYPYCDHNGDLFENTVTHHGDDGLCQITVGMVQDTGPSLWTLTVYDYSNDTILTNTFNVHFFYAAVLVEYQIRIEEYASFFNRMTKPSNFNSCTVKFNDTVIELDIHSSKTNILVSTFSPEVEEVTKRVFSLGRGLCGFKYMNATATIRHLEWTFTATDEQNTPFRASFHTRIDSRTSEENTHSRRSVYMGRSHSISCGTTPVATDTCSIFDPAGNLVEANHCLYSIASVKISDLGVWKCYFGNPTTMESHQFTMELIRKDPETVKSWQYEADGYLTMGCQMLRFTGSITYCKMIAPNQRRFTLGTTTATERYLTIGTVLREGKCSMQIKLPLQESEIGLWQCEIGLAYQDATGITISVGKPTDLSYTKHMKVSTLLNNSFKIHCSVPYFTEYCHIRAPNGTIFYSASENEIRLGRCGIDIHSATASDNGTWICSYAREMGTPDEEIVTEVTIAELLAYYKYVEVDSGDSSELICSSGGLPIKYCRFIAPNGTGYYIENHENSNTLSYYGRGLEYGDCGIKIAKTTLIDNGVWTCVTQLISDVKQPGEITARIVLDVAPTFLESVNSAAIGIGTAVGIILVGSIAGIVGMQKWRQRRHREIPGSSTADRGVNTDDNVSLNSQTNVFRMESLPRSYTMPWDEEHHQQ